MDYFSVGQVIVMNGGSSSGKTSVAMSLQKQLRSGWLRLNVDTLIDSLGPEQCSAWLPIADGIVFVTPQFTAIEDAWMSGVARMARA